MTDTMQILDELEQRFPNVCKRQRVEHQWQDLLEFLQWFDRNEFYICTPGRECMDLIGLRDDQLVARFFDIDLDKLKEEEAQLLSETRWTTTNLQPEESAMSECNGNHLLNPQNMTCIDCGRTNREIAVAGERSRAATRAQVVQRQSAGIVVNPLPPEEPQPSQDVENGPQILLDESQPLSEKGVEAALAHAQGETYDELPVNQSAGPAVRLDRSAPPNALATLPKSDWIGERADEQITPEVISDRPFALEDIDQQKLWERFRTYANENEISLEGAEDYRLWWKCFVAGANAWTGVLNEERERSIMSSFPMKKIQSVKDGLE